MRDCERNTMQNVRFAHRKRINAGKIEHFEQDEKPRNHHRRALGVEPHHLFSLRKRQGGQALVHLEQILPRNPRLMDA